MAVNIAVEGDNLGAIVVGDHNTVVINQPAGAVVLPVAPVKTTRREGPANLGPRPFPDIIDRTDEDKALRAALTGVPPSPVDVFGAPGIGKTALLRHVCGDASLQASFSDGVVYFGAGAQSTADLLQQLFEAFFETDRPFKPDDTQLRRFLARTSALVILDDYGESASEFDRLLNLAATATFAVSGTQRVLLGEGAAIALEGLRPVDAVALMSRELGRPVDESETMAARAIGAALDDNPLNVILVAAHSRVYGVALAQLANEVRAAESPEQWLKALIGSKLSDRDRKALAAFAAVDSAPLDEAEVSAISGEPAAETLEGLKNRGLIEHDGKRNRVRTGIAAAIAMSFLSMLPAEAAAQCFLHAAAQAQPGALVEHSDAILGAMKHSALSGNHAGVLALAHRAGDAIALSGRWDRWHEMLRQALDAAKAAHDSVGEAWALHQIGSRALAVGDYAAAHASLQAALHIRSGLGDPIAVAATQHNLQVLGELSGTAPQADDTAPARRRFGAKVAVGFGIAVVLSTIGAWVAARPSLTLHASDANIASGQTTRLCYTASHVSNVRFDGKPPVAECVDVRPQKTRTYSVDARGPLGIPMTQSVRVSVAPAPSKPPAPPTSRPSHPAKTPPRGSRVASNGGQHRTAPPPNPPVHRLPPPTMRPPTARPPTMPPPTMRPPTARPATMPPPTLPPPTKMPPPTRPPPTRPPPTRPPPTRPPPTRPPPTRPPPTRPPPTRPPPTEPPAGTNTGCGTRKVSAFAVYRTPAPGCGSSGLKTTPTPPPYGSGPNGCNRFYSSYRAPGCSPGVKTTPTPPYGGVPRNGCSPGAYTMYHAPAPGCGSATEPPKRVRHTSAPDLPNAFNSPGGYRTYYVTPHPKATPTYPPH